MFSKTFIISAAALLCANQVMGAAITERSELINERAALIATDAYYACNCPNNCSYKKGTKCKFYSGPSDTSDTNSGTCQYPNSNPYASLECVV
ncbi:hypothetical protein BJ170DRAFT_683228 [Xylariales sp. AK1849]|nr:hypothetical protein BJ170DRAFT_683228 [Xylariales sp. AK1849]